MLCLSESIARRANRKDGCKGPLWEARRRVPPLHDSCVLPKTLDVLSSPTLLITDGADGHSTRSKAADVRGLVEDLLRQESHIVAAMGISDGSTDFHRVFRSMGIRDEWTLTPGNSAGEIRRAFQVFSQSAVKAGSGAGGFSKLAVGGFSAN